MTDADRFVQKRAAAKAQAEADKAHSVALQIKHSAAGARAELPALIRQFLAQRTADGYASVIEFPVKAQPERRPGMFRGARKAVFETRAAWWVVTVDTGIMSYNVPVHHSWYLLSDGRLCRKFGADLCEPSGLKDDVAIRVRDALTSACTRGVPGTQPMFDD